MKVDMDFADLKRLIDMEKKERIDTSIIKVSKKSLLQGLKAAQDDIRGKYTEALKLWKRSVQIYRKFLASNPGSKQVKPPSDMPNMPKSFEELKAWIRMIDSFVEETLTLDIHFVREMFNVQARAVQEMREVRDTYAMANAGTMSLIGSFNNM